MTHRHTPLFSLTASDAVDRSLIDKIHQALWAVRDPNKSEPMQRYMKSALPFLGIQKAALCKALNPILRAHPLESELCWQATARCRVRGETRRPPRRRGTGAGRSKGWKGRKEGGT